MRTLPFTRGKASGSRRRRAAVVSGVVTVAASTTIPFVRQLGRRRHQGGTQTSAFSPRPVQPNLPTVRDPTAPIDTMREAATNVHDRVGLSNPVVHQASAYGVGFDQHSAHARGRPIAWIVVAVILAGTCTSGISLIMAAPWLFWTGVGVVVVGIILGRATHAMRDEMVPLPDASPREPQRPSSSAGGFALTSVHTACALARAGWGVALFTAPSRSPRRGRASQSIANRH